MSKVMLLILDFYIIYFALHALGVLIYILFSNIGTMDHLDDLWLEWRLYGCRGGSYAAAF